MPLALFHSNDHALAVDVAGLQVEGFGQAQAGGVAGGHNGALLGPFQALQKPADLLGAENDGQLVRLAGQGEDLWQGPLLVEGDLVEEAQGSYRQQNGTGGQLLFVGQVELVGANLLGTQQCR